MDRSILDSLGPIRTKILVETTNDKHAIPYKDININFEFNVIYLDTSITGNTVGAIFGKFIQYDFPDDIAHLYTFSGSWGGVAAVDQLGRRYPYAVSNLRMGEYTTGWRGNRWNSLVTPHESGHVIGSQHTHASVWNGNNTPIDSCAYRIFPVNPDLGTIMSYCHILNRMELKFNSQIADLFHQRLDFWGFTCESSGVR